MTGRFLIYGANGYTGKLLLDLCRQKNLQPIIAGRSAQKILELGQEYDFEARVFSLDDTQELNQSLMDVDVFVHCAGPFSVTALLALQACMRTQTHYVDITGEISVFDSIFNLQTTIRDSGIIAIPGVGFDVVPSDCLAARLKAKLPDAESLRLAFYSPRAKLSPGTSKTMVDGAHAGGCIRQGGKLVRVPYAYKTRMIPYDEKTKLSVTIPWGDVCTAWYSTQIPNIEVYTSTNPRSVRLMRIARAGQFFMGLRPVQSYLTKLIDRKVTGPTPEERQQTTVTFWGEVENPAGETVSLTMQTPEGYELTAATTLAATCRLLETKLAAGAYTPSMAFGANFIKEIPGLDIKTSW